MDLKQVSLVQLAKPWSEGYQQNKTYDFKIELKHRVICFFSTFFGFSDCLYVPHTNLELCLNFRKVFRYQNMQLLLQYTTGCYLDILVNLKQ